MKKIICLCIFFVFNNSSQSQSSWFIQPVGSGSFLNDIKMIDANTAFISAFEGRVLRTTNGGVNWITNTITSSGDLFTVFFSDINTGYTCGSQGKIFKTTNSGINWVQISSPTNFSILASFFLDNNTGFIGGGSDTDGEIFRTTNGGDNWTEAGPGVIYPQILSLSFPSVSTGYAAGRSGIILRSTNSGLSWTSLPSILGSTDYFSIYFTNENTGYAATPLGGKVIKTTNGGTNWNIVYDNSNYFPVSINFPSPDTGFVIGGAANNSVVLKTTNAGISWNDELLNFIGHLNSVDFINNTTGYIAAEFGRLYKTTNGGTSVGIVQTSSQIPEKFSLYQNYPNPFNPVTKIKFDITRDVRREMQDVKLTLFDALGKEVSILVNEKLSAGSYNYQFSTVNYQLSSGIYFYELRADKHREVKRMILLK